MGYYGFDHIYWRYPLWKLHLLYSDQSVIIIELRKLWMKIMVGWESKIFFLFKLIFPFIFYICKWPWRGYWLKLDSQESFWAISLVFVIDVSTVCFVPVILVALLYRYNNNKGWILNWIFVLNFQISTTLYCNQDLLIWWQKNYLRMEKFSASVLPRAMFYGILGRLNFRRNLGVSWKIALLKILFWEYSLYQAFFLTSCHLWHRCTAS